MAFAHLLAAALSAAPTNPSGQLSGVIQVSLGAEHSCAVFKDRTVRCWGRGDLMQLGSPGGSPRPRRVPGLDGVLEVAAGSLHTCALSPGGVTCWGFNNVGQLGFDNGNRPAGPTPSSLFGAPAALVARDNTCGLFPDGKLLCAGSNGSGQLGRIPFDSALPTPAAIPGLSPVKSLALGGGQLCAATFDGGVFCAGRADWGQGGNGPDHTCCQSLTEVQGLSGAVEVAAGGAHACARLHNGEVWCWGDNQYGQLGDGTRVQRDRPVRIRGLDGVEQLALGGFQSCARLKGTVKCWGARQDVPNIDYSDGGVALRPTPLDIGKVVELDVGGAHACARLEDSTLRCWGLNSAGQLGDGTTLFRRSPVRVLAGGQ